MLGRNINSKKGFTLIELIIVIILVGIISIYIAPKMTTKGFKEEAEVTRFMTHLRFVQHKAMVSGGLYGIEISGNRYKMLDNITVKRLPDADSDEVEVSQNLNMTNAEISDNKLYFDYLGRPIKSDRSLITSTTIFNVNGKVLKLDPYAGGIYQ
ncbi:prepilin-type N-terminal cleavage/methylation domain-containing protein [Deferribacterales bacterium Es71-Z0220]|uniref:prepilin-type N-terminal cleavage/methylation domain-containing protein n=1 Tax=Deferrivibrio essentukiensis TaxID=2880922 RepID=UPI001F60D6BA|nr:prepilin-type N-terminal cleavage/methylation domain-containing protein [Deferrivibrio essentukiensis]MCB4205312.1 prepilin-type N-terminal cleavage/methylation domain-containing protein [Deferrivibrio essentukiensis]